VERHAVYGIGFRDAAHLAAAEEAGCDARASEDFTAGRCYGGLVAVDPMSPSP
jgi:predicted nucleic acid-binding protein